MENERNLVPDITDHNPEMIYPSMYDSKKNWGKSLKTRFEDIIIRSSKTGTIYGKRKIVQRY